MFLRRSMFIVALPLLLISMLLAACGNTATTTGTTTGSTGGSTVSTATAAPTVAPAPVVMTASATVGGKSVTILTDAKGMTLYYFTPDTATTAACTTSGGCTTNWPPLLSTGSTTPTSSTTLPGLLSLTSNANGAQVQYQNHFLYTFAGDKKPGDTNGQGQANGQWLVATSDLTLLNNPSGGNGYGY